MICCRSIEYFVNNKIIVYIANIYHITILRNSKIIEIFQSSMYESVTVSKKYYFTLRPSPYISTTLEGRNSSYYMYTYAPENTGFFFL